MLIVDILDGRKLNNKKDLTLCFNSDPTNDETVDESWLVDTIKVSVITILHG
jgi:hypothetical protein